MTTRTHPERAETFADRKPRTPAAAAPSSIPRQPSPDPWAMAALDVLAEHYAAVHGDTPEITAARHAELLAGLGVSAALRLHPAEHTNHDTGDHQ